MDLKQTGSSGGRVRSFKATCTTVGKIRNWSRGGKRVPAAVHCKQQLPSDPFSNTCYLGRRGRCNRETPSSINTGVTRWPLGWLSVRFPDALTFLRAISMSACVHSRHSGQARLPRRGKKRFLVMLTRYFPLDSFTVFFPSAS